MIKRRENGVEISYREPGSVQMKAKNLGLQVIFSSGCITLDTGTSLKKFMYLKDLETYLDSLVAQQ